MIFVQTHIKHTPQIGVEAHHKLRTVNLLVFALFVLMIMHGWISHILLFDHVGTNCLNQLKTNPIDTKAKDKT